MVDSPLEIFDVESDHRPDPVVRRGIGAILGLAAVIAGIVLLAGTLVVLAAGSLSQIFTASQVDVVAFTQLSCERRGHDVVVSATISRGPDFESDFAVDLSGWEPVSLYFRSDRPDDAPSLDPGDRVSFSGPADRADEITGVRMGIWRGEPGYAQTIPLSVELTDLGCVAATP